MKNIALYTGLFKVAGLFILTPLVVYLLAIGKTVNLYRKIQNQKEILLSTIPLQTINDENYTIYDNNNDIKSGALVKHINSLITTENVVTDSFTPILTHQGNGVEIYTGKLVMNGGFHGLTSLLEKLDKVKSGYKIISVSYKTVINPGNRMDMLQLTIIFQQVIVS